MDALIAGMVGSGEPGVAVSIMEGGRSVYRACHGLADVGWRQPVAADTVFRIASVGKMVTGVTCLVLAREGLLDLEAPIGRYLPEYPAATATRISVRHLLTHTSGIPNFLTQPGWRPSASRLDHTPEQLLAVFADLPLDFAPGSRYGYSNSGYLVLDMIIARVTAQPLDQVLPQRVFQPAGMTDARLLSDADVVARAARGYQRADDRWLNAEYLSLTIAGSGGGIGATLADMEAFDVAMRDHRLLDPADHARMVTRVQLADGRTEGYGLGCVLTTYRGHTVVSHAGGINGFSSFYGRLPDRDLSVVVLSNRDGFRAATLARGILDAIAELSPAAAASDAHGPIPPPPAAWLGTYADTLGRAELTMCDGALLVEKDGASHRFLALAAHQYVDEADPDVHLHLHNAEPDKALTISYPFTWFTGYHTSQGQPV